MKGEKAQLLRRLLVWSLLIGFGLLFTWLPHCRHT